MAGRQARNGLNWHPDLPRVSVSNPIQFLSTEEVWAYLLKPETLGVAQPSLTDTPWRAPTPALRTANAPSNRHQHGQLRQQPIRLWTCTVVDRDKASEGLLASGDEMPITFFHLLSYLGS